MTASVHYDDLLGVALEAATTAGRHAFQNSHRRQEIAESFAHDVKLKLDLECQRKAEEVIRSHFPDHQLLGEEGGTYDEAADILWIIDPIDGTVNFQHGLPLWCCSIAVRAGGHIAAGAVVLPAMKETYAARRGGAATRNGEPIHVSETPRLDEALVLTGLSKNINTNLYCMDVLKAVSLKAQKTRIMGAAAVDICHVACGRADGYFESGIYLWDIAAAGLIAECAGARTEIFEKISDVRYRYLCTNGRIHDELKRVVVEGIASQPVV